MQVFSMEFPLLRRQYGKFVPTYGIDGHVVVDILKTKTRGSCVQFWQHPWRHSNRRGLNWVERTECVIDPGSQKFHAV